MEHLSDRTAFPLLFVPFTISIVLVMGSPEIEAAQPRALIGGHLVATAVGAGLLAAVAFLWHNLFRRGSWPARWW